MLRVDFARVDKLALLVGEQAVRQEEVLKQIGRMEESIEELQRRLEKERVEGGSVRPGILQYARAASKNLGILASSLEGTSMALDLVSSDIQSAVLDLRMVPLDRTFKKHQMTVFQAASAQGKKAGLVVDVGEARIDKSIAEKLEEPLIHLIRNAVSHGIATPAERVAAGKSPEGTVTVLAFQQGNQVIIRIEDDGVGIMPEVLRRKAVEKGFLTEEECGKLDDARISDLIFAPGFSTTSQVDDISGRGVGLDVVRDKINKIGGAVQVFTEPGQGTVFQLTLPLTLALAKVLLVRLGGQVVALPADNVQRVEPIAGSAIVTVDGKHMARRESGTVPLVFLGETLELSPVARVSSSYTACIVTHGDLAMAMVTDRILEHTQAVIRNVGPVLPRIEHCMGVTIFEGRCVLIVDVGSVVREWTERKSASGSREERRSVAIVTDDFDFFDPLGRLMRGEAAAVTLVAPSALESFSFGGTRTVLVDGRMGELQTLLERLAAAPGEFDLQLVTESGVPEGIGLDVVYEHGVSDVIRIDSDWVAFAARLTILSERTSTT